MVVQAAPVPRLAEGRPNLPGPGDGSRRALKLQARVTAEDLRDIDLDPYVAKDGREYVVLEIKGSAQ